MESSRRERPSVSGSLTLPGYSGNRTRREAEGAKNTRIGPGRCRIFDKAAKRTMYVATYNVQTLSTEEKLAELEAEIERVKWHILGISEMRRMGEEIKKLSSGHTLYHCGNNESKTNGVGFLIHKDYVNNITSYEGISDRIAYITIQLSTRKSMKIIQVYAPTSEHEEDEVEAFYEDITSCIRSNPANYTIIMGDLNAKIGKQQNGETTIGQFGLGDRNERGNLLINFTEEHNLYIMNTFFKKSNNRKWTWRSPNSETKNEIDFVISSHRNIIQDVTVLNRCTIGSDHRLVRAKVFINLKTLRAKSFINRSRPVDTIKLSKRRTEYQLKTTELLQNIKDDTIIESIDTKAEELTTVIKAASAAVATRTGKQKDKISDNTKQLMERRRNMNRDEHTVEWTELNKLIRKEIRKDIRTHKYKVVLETIEGNKGPKVISKKLNSVRKEIIKLQDSEGQVITNRDKINSEINSYYNELYRSKTIPNEEQRKQTRKKIQNIGSEELPEVTVDEVNNALKEMKHNKAAGPDGILSEMLLEAGDDLKQELAKLFNMCLETGKIPALWHISEVILLHKKGDFRKLDNYRPISLLSHIYKLLTKVISNRLKNKLDSYQPCEQAGFRSGYSTCDHLQTMRNILEKSNEYNFELYIAFIDYEKAFDSVEMWAIINGLNNCRIDSRYTAIIKDIYENAKMYIKPSTEQIPIGRGVRQGDTISPKLFITALEDVFRQLDWTKKGLKVDGVYLSHLRFADDIVVIGSNPHELQEMINELNYHSKTIGLKMNKSKTKILTNTNNNIVINLEGTALENVENYVYLGQKITTTKYSVSDEISRRIRLGWCAFGKLSYIFKDKAIPNKLKAKVYDQCILPVITYGAETWTLNKADMQKLARTQRAHERQMIGIKLRDRKRNKWIREQTKVKDIIEHVAERKWQWAGHIARTTDDRWTKRTLEWRPRERKRSLGRPKTRWRDDIQRVAGIGWMTTAANRLRWKFRGKAYIQHWIELGL